MLKEKKTDKKKTEEEDEKEGEGEEEDQRTMSDLEYKDGSVFGLNTSVPECD